MGDFQCQSVSVLKEWQNQSDDRIEHPCQRWVNRRAELHLRPETFRG